jgi:4,5-dihydroxyphthalate decarboxylase
MTEGGDPDMADLPLTMALERRDRSLPLLDGVVGISGVELRVLDIESNERHHRMLQEGEFDLAEVSLSSFLIARDQGLPFAAIPSLPHRYFSQSQMLR